VTTGLSADAFDRAVALHRAGNLAEAKLRYEAIVDADPRHGRALHLLGVIAAQERRYERAHELIARSLAVDPHSAEANADDANVLNALARFEDALARSDRALAVAPRNSAAHYSRALALHHLRRHDEALAHYDHALALQPNLFAALVKRGAVLHALGRDEDAVETFARVLGIDAANVEALYNRGLALQALQRHEAALESYAAALRVQPDLAEALNNCGLNLQCLRRRDEALACYDRALAARPDFAEALYNRAALMSSLGRFERASEDAARALALDPDLPYARGTLLHSRMYRCDWKDHDTDVARLLDGVRRGERAAEPATLLNISDAASDQLRCAHTWAEDKYRPHAPLRRAERSRHDRIRIAYLSADFRAHATAYLMAGLFERHDRRRFDVTAISFGGSPGDEMTSRLKAGFERFVDARDMRDADVANLLSRLEIDIAVDLQGYTDGARTPILALRPAPLQVAYLGYPGTMGAPFIDYILADTVVIPPEDRECYAEQVVYLPGTYQVNDDRRAIAAAIPSRADVHLPESGFVFCSFNQSYKITPAIFDVWMRLLRATEGSVLWLLDGHPDVRTNLRREAGARGVAADRLVFAPRLTLADHLARHRCADLFLDTLPCNAHTTASDALWAGLPVVTCLGRTFAGRVAASLLHAVGLPELVARDLGGYETLALRLAADPDRLADTKERLSRARGGSALFDTDRFRRHIEAGYVEMWDRHLRGERPRSFTIPAGA